MYRVFNCGIGFVVIVGKDKVEDAMALLKAMGEKAYIIGKIEPLKKSEVSGVFLI